MNVYIIDDGEALVLRRNDTHEVIQTFQSGDHKSAQEFIAHESLTKALGELLSLRNLLGQVLGWHTAASQVDAAIDAVEAVTITEPPPRRPLSAAFIPRSRSVDNSTP